MDLLECHHSTQYRCHCPFSFWVFKIPSLPLQYCYDSILSTGIPDTEIYDGVLCVCQVTSVMSNSATLWTAAYQAPVSIGFSRQEYWSGLPLPPPDNLPNPWDWTHVSMSPALAGGFFTISATWSLQILDPFLSLELGVSAVILQWCFLFHSHSSSLCVPCLPATLCYLLSPSPLLSFSWTHPHCSFLLEDQGTGSSSIIVPTLASLRTYASFEAHLRFRFPLRALPLLPTGYESQNDLHLLLYLPYLTSCHDVCTCVIMALDVNFL